MSAPLPPAALDALLATLPAWSAVVALAVALLALEPRARLGDGLTAMALVALAALLGGVASPAAGWAAAGVALVVAMLARERDDRLETECALKLTWMVAPALALGWGAVQLLALAAGTDRPAEQWGVLALGIDPPALWRTALPLSLLAGVALTGAVPFHTWLSDLLHGARAGVAPLAAAALQTLGAGWLLARVAGVEAFPEAHALVTGTLGLAATVSLLGGAIALLTQRRPERRVGALASLQGGLVLAVLAATRPGHPLQWPGMGAWSAHLALALAGAGWVARFLPVADARGPAPTAALFRRHPLAGLAGLFALLSLAGVPGTPGARAWFEAASLLAHRGRMEPLLALGVAWVAALAVAVRETRAAFGPLPADPPPAPVPPRARVALFVAAAGLVAFGIAYGWR